MRKALRKTRQTLILTLIVMVLFASITAPSPVAIHARPALDSQVDAILAAMTPEQRIGQLFMVSIYGEGLPDSNKAFLDEMQPGAVALFTDNGTTPYDVTRTINAWQTEATQIGAHIPLIVATDQEGGTVTRLTDGFTPLPWGAALGAMPPEDARKVGQMAADELRAVGITMNLAPVADVRSDPTIKFMERRTFGSDPQIVAQAVAAYVQGLQDQNVIGVLKHFPGHGAADDSHNALPVVNASHDQVETVELAPFRAGIQSGVDAVMVGHLVYPALDPTPDMPASLSPTIIGSVLRKELGFQGLIMTDAMDMGAIVNSITRPVASVMAIQAGIDLIVTGPHTPMPEQLAMKQAVIDAVKRGVISQARIAESARRVLMLKAKYMVLDWLPLDPATANERVDMPAHEEIAGAIYLDTVAIAQDADRRLPLTPGAQKVAMIFPGVFPSIERECSVIDVPSQAFSYTLTPTDDELTSIPPIARTADVVLIFTYNIEDYPAQATLVNLVPPDKAVVIALQSPYDFEQGIQPGGYVAAFNAFPAAFKATCEILYGQHQAIGQWRINSALARR